MARSYSIPRRYSNTGGATAALITAAMLVVAILAAAAVYLIEYSPAPNDAGASNFSADTRIEQVPNQAAQAISPSPSNAEPTGLDRAPTPALPQH